MKAVGLNLIMAQAGLYVACSKFKFMPYSQIFTRILNNDNIFKSQSSFAVEMNELRTIMNMANDKTLVLGDEVCSGTETTSAISLIFAGLATLCKKKSTFVFTSHFHQLTKLDKINNIDNLKIYHLKIDNDGNKIIYNRKLQLGPGPSIYGIQVGEALGLPTEFIKLAKEIQSELDDEPSIKKTSPYNNNMIMNKCKICSKKAEETNHIKEQCIADENNMIDHHHKNNEHNLVQLCKKCHDKITYGKLVIDKYILTTSGKELVYHTENKKQSRKKYDDEMVEKILGYKNSYTLNKSYCIKKIKLELNIKIGPNTLKKIMEKSY